MRDAKPLLKAAKQPAFMSKQRSGLRMSPLQIRQVRHFRMFCLIASCIGI
ncbi:MAG: hypothetical protein Q4D60_07960 [Eubacteriales bacterium]|nr:hypothetical protein [Eubacteriales bacterium]